MRQQRQELLNWEDVDKLVDHLLPQFEIEFTAMVMITRGGIVPGGMLAEATGITHILNAAVDFPAEEPRTKKETDRLLVWPKFIQFPEAELLRGRRTLVVDDVWGSGRTITAVKNQSLCSWRLSIHLCLSFQPLPQPVRFSAPGLLCRDHRCLYRLPLGD